MNCKPIAEFTDEELQNEKNKMNEYKYWYENEGRRYYKMLDKVSLDPDLPENEMLEFMYLRACYNLNVKPLGIFEGNAAVCYEVMKDGGDILEMYRKGCDPIYAALLSNPDIDKDVLQKTIDQHIPF
jgi:hypothetical protein